MYLGNGVWDGEEMEKTGNVRDVGRQQRMQEMRRRKKQQESMRKMIVLCVVVLAACIILVGVGISRLVRKQGNKKTVKQAEATYDGIITDSDADNEVNKNIGCYRNNAVAAAIKEQLAYAGALIVRMMDGKDSNVPLYAVSDGATAIPGSEVISENVVFIDVEAGRMLGQKNAMVRISPASMTKILTVLVAAEHVADLDDTFEITRDITDYGYVNGCSNAGFGVGERVTVRDLFYGTVLPSGADAAVGLAVYVAGSQEAFVGLMNEKIDELGLSGTSHFTNCVGIYDEEHYSTVYDMAVMLKAAYDNNFCREVLSAHIYTTSATDQNPEGITISNWFLRRIEDRDTHGEVLCAKTGFVNQSGYCAASLSIGKDQKEYICVTAHSVSKWQCIYDHVALCQQFLPE